MNLLSSTFRELAVKAAVVPRQESQASLEPLTPQGLQVLRDRPARKDPWDHVETKAKMAIQEVKASRAPRDLQTLFNNDNTKSKGESCLKNAFFLDHKFGYPRFGINNSLAGLNIYCTFLPCYFHFHVKISIVFSRESPLGIILVFIYIKHDHGMQ